MPKVPSTNEHLANLNSFKVTKISVFVLFWVSVITINKDGHWSLKRHDNEPWMPGGVPLIILQDPVNLIWLVIKVRGEQHETVIQLLFDICEFAEFWSLVNGSLVIGRKMFFSNMLNWRHLKSRNSSEALR